MNITRKDLNTWGKLFALVLALTFMVIAQTLIGSIQTVSACHIVYPVPLTITAKDQTKIFGETLTFEGTEFVVAGLEGTDTVTSVTFTTDGASASSPVGKYNIVPSQAVGTGLWKYKITYIEGKLTIDPLTIHVTAYTQSKTFGENDPALSYTYTPGLVGCDTFTGELAREAGEDVGTYPITQGTLTLSSNYVLDFDSSGAGLTIDPLTIHVTADTQSKTFGVDDPALSYTYTPGLVGCDTFTGEMAREAGEDIGTYPITQGTLTLSSNYVLDFDSSGAGLTIDHLIIHVTVSAQSKTFGEDDPALTYTGANPIIVEIPASFGVSNLMISPSKDETWAGITFTREINDDVLVTVEVTNMGGQSGTYHGVLKLNGEEFSSEDITLEPGQSGQLTFNVSDLPSGDYTVEVEDLSGEFSRDSWINWWLISTSILNVVFIGYLVKRFGIDGDRLNWTFEEGEN